MSESLKERMLVPVLQERLLQKYEAPMCLDLYFHFMNCPLFYLLDAAIDKPGHFPSPLPCDSERCFHSCRLRYNLHSAEDSAVVATALLNNWLARVKTTALLDCIVEFLLVCATLRPAFVVSQ